jgi:hypothetical protein
MTNKAETIRDHEQMKLHRIKMKVLSFKELVKEVYKTNTMSHDQFFYLNEAAKMSDDFNDSLTLNKLTCIFPVSQYKLN